MIYEAPVKDMMFLLEEWIGIDALSALPGYEHVDRDTCAFILEEAGKFCARELLPLNAIGDEQGAQCTEGIVTTPPGFREAYKKFCENGWPGLDAHPEHGGQGLPRLLQFLIDEMLGSCNMAFKLYAELTHGAYHLIDGEADSELKMRYLPNMAQGSWSGTMCLTEPHCGTDLGLLTTRASKSADGSYRITGTKIFITSGDHDLTENIIHMVLARLEGAPEGVKGISLFLVPKFKLDEHGEPAERNGVTTSSIEHKMGIKGSATCVLNFDEAQGLLVGTENRGLAAMFRMMNVERIAVGIQGLGVAEIAYQNALAYALDRRQSRAPAPRPDPGKAADRIVYLPDIQRKLLKIRAQVEGARALAVFAGYHADVMARSEDAGQVEESDDWVSLLTPLLKSYLSDMGLDSALEAQQVFGGHGYVREWGMEQLVRDVRITQIYEGTNEVQAVDLVGRKLDLHQGRLFNRLIARWDGLKARVPESRVDGVASAIGLAMGRLEQSTACIRAWLVDDECAALAAATDYQRQFAITVVGMFWLEICLLLEGRDDEWAEGKFALAQVFAEQVLPETEGLMRKVEAAENVASLAAVLGA